MDRMSTAEATVATLLAHGLDTVYALPGVHNDFLFDAFFKAGEKLRVVHTRHEQGAGYMALGAALATNRPHAYAVVPGPGLLNTSSALLTAYSMNAPVLALIGQIPDADIGRGIGHLHEIRDQAGSSCGWSISPPASARLRRAGTGRKAMQGVAFRRPGPAALECAIDVWGREGVVPPIKMPSPPRPSKIDEDAIRKAAKILGQAERPLIIAGGGAQGAAEEVAELSAMLQAPVSAWRRGRGVLSSRDPFSVTLPLGHELWGEADVAIGIGTHMVYPFTQWGVDRKLKVVRIDADPKEPARLHKPAAALIGDAKPILRRLLDLLPKYNRKRASRRDDMQGRQTKWAARFAKLTTQMGFLDAIRVELPEDGIFVDEVTQLGFAARLAFPVYRPRTFLSPGYQDNLGWGFATALGVQDARRDVPVVSINGDGGFMYTANELATAMRHKIPLTAIVFADGAFGNVRRIQEERFGNRLIASDHSVSISKLAQASLRRRAGAHAGRAACRAAAQLRAPRPADADRGAGRADAEPLGVHPSAEGARGLTAPRGLYNSV
jgi:acetolactate synthase-1/2/3 large subunit